MSYSCSINRVAEAEGAAFEDRKRTLLRRLAHRFSRWLKYHHDRQHVQELPDYLIRDIGLRRQDVRDALKRNNGNET